MNHSSLLASAFLAALPVALVLPGCGGGNSSSNPTPTTALTAISTPTATITAIPSATIAATPTATPWRPVRETYINVAAARITEGNSGKKALKFVVSAHDTYGERFPLAFSYKTVDGSAIAGQDYVATAGKSQVTTGSTTTISVPIIGDRLVEEDETFKLQVFALARDGIAENIGTIVSDEPPISTATPTPIST